MILSMENEPEYAKDTSTIIGSNEAADTSNSKPPNDTGKASLNVTL